MRTRVAGEVAKWRKVIDAAQSSGDRRARRPRQQQPFARGPCAEVEPETLGFVGGSDLLEPAEQNGCGKTAMIRGMTADDIGCLGGGCHRMTVAQLHGWAYGEC